METMQYQRKHVTAYFRIVSFEKTSQELGVHGSSRTASKHRETDLSRTQVLFFITGSKHRETDESSRPQAKFFRPFLSVWNP